MIETSVSFEELTLTSKSHFQKSYFDYDCSKRCEHGEVVNDECVCHDCYSSAWCDLECSDHGQCTNQSCVCDHTEKGKIRVI